MSHLAGRRIVVTRRAGQSSALVELLQELGAEVVEVPSIAIAAPADTVALDAALATIAHGGEPSGADRRYDWIVFTSANAVNAVAGRLVVLGLAPRLTERGTRVASVGAATSATLRATFPGDAVALEPAEDFRALGLLRAFERVAVRGARVLVPGSSRAREELPAGLRALGAQVDDVVAYEVVEPPDLLPRVVLCLEQGFDLVTFASPSAVETFAAAAGERVRGLPAVAIGPTTAEAARAVGLDLRAVAAPSTVEGLVAAAERALAE